MPAELGRSSLSRLPKDLTSTPHLEVELVGETRHQAAGVAEALQLAIAREGDYRCHHCGIDLPPIDETTEMSRTGPILLLAEKESTCGVYDRTRAWYCVACAVNHRHGLRARIEGLRQGWGRLLAWGPNSVRADCRYLSGLMHAAARAGAQNSMPWLGLAGLQVGDLWVLNKWQRVQLVKLLPGFPIERPDSLSERALWSGPKLVAALEEGRGGWGDLAEHVFVILESSCFDRHVYASHGPQAPAPQPVKPPVPAAVDRPIMSAVPEEVQPAVVVPTADPFGGGGAFSEANGRAEIERAVHAFETPERVSVEGDAPIGVDEEAPPDF